MKKLNLKDIKIKSSGKQIKEAILDEFDSIEEFATVIDLYPNSLKRYLRSTTVPNSFKIKLVNTLSKGYNQVVLSEIQQIKLLVNEVSENIEAYKDEDDVKTLMQLKDLCLEKNMTSQIVKMNRNISIYYYSKNDMGFAIEYMRLAISGIENNQSFLVSCMSWLGLMYFMKHDYSKSKEVLEEADTLLPNIKDSKILFYYYYRRGVLYSCMYEKDKDKLELAKQMFENAIKYAKEKFQLGFAIMNIGIVYRKQNILEEAMKYYHKALENLENDFDKSVLYNNLADGYKLTGRYEEASYYIKKAFECLGDKNIAKSFIYYQTYVQIKMLRGESKAIIEKLKELLQKIDDFLVYRETVIKGINTIIDYGRIYENTTVLEELDDLITKLREECDEKFEKELKACSWDIRIILDNINEGRRRLGL